MNAGTRNFLLGALGIGLFLALWETIGQLKLAGISWPPLSAVLEMLADENRWPLFRRAPWKRPRWATSGAPARASASPPWRTCCRRCAAARIAWPRC